MGRKLTENTIASIKLHSENTYFCSALRCFVKSYNADERMYTVICLKPTNGNRIGKSMLVREKSIDTVEEQLSMSPDLRLWDISDAIGFCTYEYEILSAAVAKLPASDVWAAYARRYKELVTNPSSLSLSNFLDARRQHATARAMPFHGTTKSRVVMRRLRAKEKMRNSNSRMSAKRSRATYYTPSQLVEGQLTNKPAKNKSKKKKKKKAVPADINGDELLSVSFYGLDSAQAEPVYGYSLAPGIGGSVIAATSSGRPSLTKS